MCLWIADLRDDNVLGVNEVPCLSGFTSAKYLRSNSFKSVGLIVEYSHTFPLFLSHASNLLIPYFVALLVFLGSALFSSSCKSSSARSLLWLNRSRSKFGTTSMTFDSL